MKYRLKEIKHSTKKDALLSDSQNPHMQSSSGLAEAFTVIIIICIMIFCTGISAQQIFYNDLIIFKDGKILTDVKASEDSDSLTVTTSRGVRTVYKKKDVSEVIDRGFYLKNPFKDLVVFKDGTLWSGTQTLVSNDSLIVTRKTGETTLHKKSDISEVMKGVFDISNGYTDRVTLNDKTVLEPVQTSLNRDLLLVFKEDGTAAIYRMKEISRVEKIKAEGSIKPGETVTSQTGLELVSIPAGEFIMGCSDGDNECGKDEKPAHKVKITKPFFMGKYEITQGQWKAVMGSNPSFFLGEKCDTPKGCDNHPVEQLNLEVINEFLTKLNAKEGRTGNQMYRLPTEAEWEYAARAGTTARYYAGDYGTAVWYSANSGDKTHPVGQKKPNAFGLHDMLGNVSELVSDLYNKNQYSSQVQSDPLGPSSGSLMILRGGQYNDYASRIRSSSRYFFETTDSYPMGAGFRVAVFEAKVNFQPTPIKGNWSAYQGNMNWEDARKKCAGIGMRLPAIEELREAYSAGLTEPWNSDGSYYWSSTAMGKYLAHILPTVRGSDLVYYTYHKLPVRCIDGVYTKKQDSEEVTKADPSGGKWSEYQGNTSWDDAKRKCARIGMRLPTRDELTEAYTSGLSEGWTGEQGVLGRYYWTSEEYPVESAYFVSMSNGHIGHYMDRSWFGMPNNARCIRD